MLALSINAKAQTSQKVNLSGSVDNLKIEKVYLQKYENKTYVTIDSSEIKDGRFSFSKSIVLPEIYGLSFTSNVDNPFTSYLVFLDNGNINVKLDSIDDFKNTIVDGSKEQLLYENLLNDSVDIKDVARKHPKSIAALYIFYRYYSYKMSPSDIRSTIALFDKSLQTSTYAKAMYDLAKTISEVDTDKQAPDFIAFTSNNEEVHPLTLAKRKYLLIDFWASWCPPCRKENPNLVKTYAEFKNKGFSIISISLDSSVELWKKAISKDNLEWTQLIDRKAWNGDGIKKYGIRLIPSNFLIDSNGKIIAKNLKGENLRNVLLYFIH
jgi:peroxiredoxin